MVEGQIHQIIPQEVAPNSTNNVAAPIESAKAAPEPAKPTTTSLVQVEKESAKPTITASFAPEFSESAMVAPELSKPILLILGILQKISPLLSLLWWTWRFSKRRWWTTSHHRSEQR